MKPEVNDLGRDRVPNLVLRLAIPSMLAQFVSVLYSIVDRMFVGNIPGVGELALAGVGVCGPIVAMLGAVAFWVGVGGAPMMAMRLGAGEREKTEKILSNSFLLLCALALLLTVAALPLREPMLRLFGASDATYPYAEEYFTIYVCGTLFALISTGMCQFIISQGFAVAGMRSVLLGAVMNIALDPLLIFVFDMGIAGAALATVISQAASAVYVLYFLFGKRTVVRIRFGGYSFRLMGRIMALGLTPFLICAVDNVMIIAMNTVLQRYGGAAQGDILVTSNAIVQSFMLVLTMPMSGITAGAGGILSYNFGACKADRVLTAQRFIALLCVSYALLMFILARVAGPLFVSLFTSDAVIAEQACTAIRVCTLAIIPLGIQFAVVDAFTAMGQMKLALPLSFWRKLVYFVAVFALPAYFGAEAVFYAEPISDVIGPIVSATVYAVVIGRVLGLRASGSRVRLGKKRQAEVSRMEETCSDEPCAEPSDS